MSSVTAKKVARTYSRQSKRPLRDEEPPTKRRRIEIPADGDVSAGLTTSDSTAALRTSSPACKTSAHSTSSPNDSPAVFSDEPPRSSPPSSPTPRSSPPALHKRRPVFAFLKKHVKPKTPAKEPLAERSHNAQSQKQPPAKKRMVQMQLDLASQHRKACKTCGMEYIPSNAEDAALHRKFHAMNLGGVDFTKPAIERFRKTEVWSGGDGSFISVIGRKDALALRNRASDILKVVNMELAAVSIPDEELWGQAGRTVFADAPLEETRAHKTIVPAEESFDAPLVDRFKIYLYFRGNKCVGACLAERIWEAYTVLDQHDESEKMCELLLTAQSSSVSISTASEPAMLGISRIWTSSQCRKQGVASRLLETARSHFLYGITVEKEMVAFSQPTESGGNLARKWFGRLAGWHVYID